MLEASETITRTVVKRILILLTVLLVAAPTFSVGLYFVMEKMSKQFEQETIERRKNRLKQIEDEAAAQERGRLRALREAGL